MAHQPSLHDLLGDPRYTAHQPPPAQGNPYLYPQQRHSVVVMPQPLSPQLAQQYQPYISYPSPYSQYASIPQYQQTISIPPPVQQQHAPQYQTYPQRAQEQQPAPYPQRYPPAIQQQPTPQPETASQSRRVRSKASAETYAMSEMPEPQPQPQPQPQNALPVDYSLLLLSLAEEYIDAAHGMGSMVALMRREPDAKEYCKLLANGLGCMEAALKNRLYPRMEATVRLRYASLLHEETENSIEAEEVLGKGIALCERSRLSDLKYSMHHLLARVMFKTNSRVALKAIDKIIPDVETYQYIAWVYAFRFLRATLSLQVSSHPETLSALQHLRSISSLAESRGDRAIRVTSAALEAMAHLRAMGSDSIELAQRAIASARSYQLDPSMHQLPQITALLDCLDLACSLQQFSPEQAATKLQAMQFVMDRVNKDDRWNADGTFSIPIQTNTPSQLTASTGGIFQRNDDGEALTLCWLRRSELYTLGYFLSGVATMHRVAADVKSEKYLTEGLKCTHDNFRPQENPSTSLSHASARLSSRAVMNWYMRVHLVFVFCNRSDWPAAERALKELQEAIQTTAFDVPEPLRLLITYLRGVLYQAAGDTEAALSVFQSPSLILQAGTPKTSDSRNDLALLATLNTILIVRTGSHLNHKLASKLIAQVEPLCLSHPNKSLASALWLLRATGVSATEVAPTIIEVKQCLQRSLHAAKSVSNNQLVAYTMTLLTDRLFTKIIGEQAEKSARTMRALVGKTASSLWTCVADGMLADTLDGNSKSEEAARFRAEATRLTQELPKPLLEKYMDGQMEGS